jgi:hypothetical protein
LFKHTKREEKETHESARGREKEKKNVHSSAFLAEMDRGEY